MTSFLFALLFFLPCADNDAIRITVKPQQVYIERGTSSQLLNFDFLLENLTGEKLRISSIRVSVYDRSERLLMRKLLDEHGLSPAINTLPKTEIEGRASLYLFNPFYSFDHELDIKSLKYEFIFANDRGQTSHRSEAVVVPLSYRTRTKLTLPLKGRVVVENGHDFYSPHRRIDLTHPAAQMVGLAGGIIEQQ